MKGREGKISETGQKVEEREGDERGLDAFGAMPEQVDNDEDGGRKVEHQRDRLDHLHEHHPRYIVCNTLISFIYAAMDEENKRVSQL